MPDKYSFAKCEQYGRRLAARLGQQHFGSQPEATLDGPALLQLTPLRQLNLLVLHQLLGRWQHEAEGLRSPYFDFEAAPVQAALGQFMNVLSRHIRLGRAALEPLLAQATAATLLLRTDPGAAFERLLLPPAGADDAEAPVPLAFLRERLRYLDQSKAFFEGFVAGLPGGNALLSREFLRQRFELYRASHYQQLPPLAPLVAELSALLPLTEADLWDDGPAKPAPARPNPAGAPAPAAPQATPLPTAPRAPQATPPPVLAEAPKPPTLVLAAEVLPPAGATGPTVTAAPPVAAPPAPVAPPPAPLPPAASPATESSPAPPAPTGRPAAPAQVPPAPTTVPLYAKLQATQPGTAPLATTLREASHSSPPTLAERGAPKIGSLREAISINQRYSFINELFGGENMEYHAAIAHLDTLPSAAAALAYVQQELAPRHDWAHHEEHVGKLLKLLERKFDHGA